MQRRSKRAPLATDFSEIDTGYDLDSLLHPAEAFEHPSNVVNDPDLTLNEKRAILASWASDACAIEAAPALRCPLGGKKLVRFDEVIEALRSLDQQLQPTQNAARYQRMLRRERLSKRSDRADGDHGQGHGLN